MTRRTRRRISILGAAALIGFTVPEWAPGMLGHLPMFSVSSVEVEGIVLTSADEIIERASLPSEASIWDDPTPFEERLKEHPLVVDAKIRRSGLRQLTIDVEEVVPVAVAATPQLVPVDAGGHVLPVDPAVHMLDLPILSGADGPAKTALQSEESRRAVAILAELLNSRPAVFAMISEVRPTPAGDGLELVLLDDGPAQRMLLPLEGAMIGLRRIEVALGSRPESTQVLTADARFADQVVIRPKKKSKEGV